MTCRIVDDAEGLAQLDRVLGVAPGHYLHRDDGDVVSHHVMELPGKVLALLTANLLRLGLGLP